MLAILLYHAAGIAAKGRLYAVLFCASGSISDPQKGYHFEIVCPSMRDKRDSCRKSSTAFIYDAEDRSA